MRQIETNRLITDYLSGNMNPKDVEELNSMYDSERGWREFKKRVPAWKSRTSHGAILWQLLGTAAILAIAIVFSFRLGTNNIQQQFANVEIAIPNGSRSSVTLPDGSTVLLNGGSSITYSQGFGITDRNLTISGEGYFEVEHNESLPMRVTSDNLAVEVLGTKFSYKDYGNEALASVALTQGSVKVSAGEQLVLLVPGQAAVVNTSSGLLSVQEEMNDNLLAWRSGRFVFDEVSLEEITAELSRAFDMSFTFASEDLKNLSFYASFAGEGTSCTSILNVLSATGAFSYSVSGREVVIRR